MAWTNDPSPAKDATAFETKVLELWGRTRLPLTRANILAVTGAPRAKAETWLDAMARAELIELDSDDDGELLWRVRGATRPEKGLDTLDAVLRMQSLNRDIEVATPSRGGSGRGAIERVVVTRGEKSVVASGLLSFFFGPLGLLYAAPLKVALPATLAWILVGAVLPKFLILYLMGVVSPVCAVAGVLYALAYNRKGERANLLGEDPPRPRLGPGRD